MVHFLASAIHRQCPVIPFALITGLAAPLLLLTATRASANDFESCTRGLIDAGVATASATAACSQALHPTDVSNCTIDIAKLGDLEADQALLACQSDRRPQELATCVTDIHQSLEVANSTAVLNNCRNSLLPKRYADCVVGVATAADLVTAESMAQCIAAGTRPENVAPTFIFSR